LKLNAKKDVQLEYLRKQLEQAMRKNQREVLSTPMISAHEPSEEENESHHDSRGEEEE